MKRFMLLSAFLFFYFFPSEVGLAARQPLDCQSLEGIFGADAHVEKKNDACFVEITRREIQPTHMGKRVSPETMDIAFHISFEPVGDEQTAVMGEFALLESEVNPVIKALQNGNIDVSALHNHMIDEQPRILFVHFQAIGDMKQQASALRMAIAATGQGRPQGH